MPSQWANQIAVVLPDISQTLCMLAECAVILAHASLGAAANETKSLLGEQEVGWDNLSSCFHQFVLPYSLLSGIRECLRIAPVTSWRMLPGGPPGARMDRLRPLSMLSSDLLWELGMSFYTSLLVSLCGVYSNNGSGAVQLVINILTGHICLTGKVEEAFLLEKNINVFLQAVLAIIIFVLKALPSSFID